jgi:hypothetical protein
MFDQVYFNIGSLDRGQLRQVAETLVEIANDPNTRDQSHRTINIRREGLNDIIYEVSSKTGAVGTGYHRRITLRTPSTQNQPDRHVDLIGPSDDKNHYKDGLESGLNSKNF